MRLLSAATMRLPFSLLEWGALALILALALIPALLARDALRLLSQLLSNQAPPSILPQGKKKTDIVPIKQCLFFVSVLN